MKTNTIILHKNGVKVEIDIPLNDYNDTMENRDKFYNFNTEKMYKLKREVYFSDPKIYCEIINYDGENIGNCEYLFLLDYLSTEYSCGIIEDFYTMFYNIIRRIVKFKYIINPIDDLACNIDTKEVYKGSIYDVYNAFGINKFCRKMGSYEDYTLGKDKKKNFLSEGGGKADNVL